MEPIVELKERGNDRYRAKEYAIACSYYAECIEKIRDFELISIANIQITSGVKQTVFLNLAMCNLKMGGFEECRRCCNVALVFCNFPYLPITDLGVSDDVTIDITEIMQPVIPILRKVIGKSLFKRAECYQTLKQFKLAYRDICISDRILPDNVEVRKALRTIDAIIKGHPDCESNSSSVPTTSIDNLITNGGNCLCSVGYWSQCTTDVQIVIPLSELIPDECTSDSGGSIKKKSPPSGDRRRGTKSDLNVHFTKRSLMMIYCQCSLPTLQLQHEITPDQCTWYLETVYLEPNQQTYCLILHLTKSLPLEWFAGCEWWDRVFIYDHPIDTSFCTVDTDIAQLPTQALEKARSSHAQFMSLDPEAWEKEISARIQLKKAFLQHIDRSLSNRPESIAEDVSKLEDKGNESIDWLRQEFPATKFTLKDDNT